MPVERGLAAGTFSVIKLGKSEGVWRYSVSLRQAVENYGMSSERGINDRKNEDVCKVPASSKSRDGRKEFIVRKSFAASRTASDADKAFGVRIDVGARAPAEGDERNAGALRDVNGERGGR